MLRSLVIAALLLGSTAVSAQFNRDARDFGLPADDWCREATRRGRDREARACDVREDTLAGVQTLDVDTGGNGGIRVRGTSGSAPRVRVRIVAQARNEGDARDLASDVRVTTAGGRVRITGPRLRNNEWWSADVEVESPRDLPLTLTSNNGGISLENLTTRARFDTTNGGLSLTSVGGDMRGRTVNGGISVRLDGSRWDGAGLDLETTNGGVRMSLPDGYSAELAAETANGGLNIDFPITVQGRLSRLDRRIVSTLGSGGPRLHVRTVNGGVSIDRR